MQPIALLAFQLTAVHPMIGFQVTNNGLNGLAPLELPFFLRRQPLGLAPVNDAHARILGALR